MPENCYQDTDLLHAIFTSLGQLREEQHELAPHDVFVAPQWVSYSFAADSDLELFSYSDRAGQEALGYWREQVG